MSALSSKLRSVEGDGLMFWCPGCDGAHVVYVGDRREGPRWGFNGDNEAPTFTPSVLVRSGHYATMHDQEKGCWCSFNTKQIAEGKEPSKFSCSVCHFFVTAGQMIFLQDCTHALAGKTVPMPDFDAG